MSAVSRLPIWPQLSARDYSGLTPARRTDKASTPSTVVSWPAGGRPQAARRAGLEDREEGCNDW
jgi:hypothetical protein